MKVLYAARVVDGVVTLGPGRRIGLWVEGCTLACVDCMSPDLFERRTPMTTAAVADRIVELSRTHDGLTVSGGEPFQQADALCDVLRRIRSRSELDVLLYSGFRRSEIEAGSPASCELLGLADLLIDGRFETTEPSRARWRGSNNQQLHVLTARGALALERPQSTVSLQLVAEAGGVVRLIGVPFQGVRENLHADLRRAGFALRKNV